MNRRMNGIAGGRLDDEDGAEHALNGPAREAMDGDGPIVLQRWKPAHLRDKRCHYMPAAWIEFDPYTDPYEQWRVIEDFTCSNPVVVIEYRRSDRESPLCGRHAIAHWDQYSDIAFGTVHYEQVRHAAAREQVMDAHTIVVYAYGMQVGQSYKDRPPPEDLIERARMLLTE